MADHSSHPLDAFPFDRVAPAGRYGLGGPAGFVARRVSGLSIATLAARRGADTALAEAIGRLYGLDLPQTPRAVFSGATGVIGVAPGRWLALSRSDGDIAGTLRAALGPIAAVTDQSDASIAFELTGPHVADTLAKGALIDLDPRIFHPGEAATTVLAHIGVTLWREESAWRLLVARSFEASLLRFLIASAAEYGFELDGRG